MIDLHSFSHKATLLNAARQARDLSEADFLGGPGGGAPGDIEEDPIFGTEMATALADLATGAGLCAPLAPGEAMPSQLLRQCHMTIDGCAYYEITDVQGMILGVAAFGEGTVPAGLYTGCTLIVDPDNRGQGIGTRVILPGLKSGASFSFTGDCGRHGPAVLCRLQRRSRVAAADAVPRRP